MPIDSLKEDKYRRGSVAAHNALVDEILLRLGSFTCIRLWRNETGAAYREGKLIHYGVKGSPDIEGILSPNGTYIGFECKTGRAVQSDQQRAWEAMIKRMGGYYFVVHSTQEALEYLSQVTSDSWS